MSQRRAALITGLAGGIGGALGRVFREAGYRVVGLGRSHPGAEVCDAFVEADLAVLGRDEAAVTALWPQVEQALDGAPLAVLVNNAAVQHLGGAGEIRWDHWQETLAVNLSAPFALARASLPALRETKGCVVNIGSVHAQSTKPGFAAYATSKAALHGLTRALAVDLGPEVRVVALAPAAIDTPMLRAGFEGRPEGFAALEGVHPAGRIGTPDEVARAALFLASPDAGFITGAVLWQDGGVLSRLHDPV